MKKSILVSILVVSLLFSVFCFTACNPDVDDDTIAIFTPDGAPSLSMAKLMLDKPVIDGLKTSYEIVSGTNIQGKVLNGEADIAIVPTNMASILYNKGVDIKAVTINSAGLLYMVGKENIENLDELKGEIVFCIGEGATPDLTFQYILNSANIEYLKGDEAVEGKVVLNYVQDGSELIPLLKSNKAKFGILGEPAVTMAIEKADCIRLFDIQQLWNDASGTTNGYPQTTLIIKTSLIESNPNFVKGFIEKLEENAEWIIENSDKVGAILKDNGSMSDMSYSKDIIEKCNICVINAKDIKTDVDTYLNVLYNFNKQTVGGRMPDIDFYYNGN